MILGVYWYYKFPENLYDFQFFKFFRGYGGHANNPAELETKVQLENPEDFIKKLEDLKTQFPKTYLHLKISGSQLIITTGDFMLFDYHFQFAIEIEKLLSRENAVLLDIQAPIDVLSSKNYRPEQEKFENIEHRFIQMASSDFKENNAENFSIRIDCNLPLADKNDLINDLVHICNEENLNVFYYNDSDFKDHCNLMLFFTNGRQKKDAIQNVHINSFGSKVRHLTEKFPLLHFGHLEGLQHYPLNGPHINIITDEEYIINKK
ncbi:hypothetical protein F3J23_02955 [Chryseobacterium sp. Tr-659]|uniref:hypothetical protein n=1 Tax=Chryseobacterium sp. Tr-659 TaxID=2608340 RepID=UPI00141F4266|nr:hypothetical protein [Chryseobacterium sp. Tr-659]NIF04390.1 hypothetical protein [Chryseobacterium sp. Tr-659]